MPPLRKRYSNNFLQNITQTIENYQMVQPGDSVLVGVSGGPDSSALLHALHTLAPRFSLKLGVAHLNHSLRPKDSHRDAEFTAALAAKCQLPFFLKTENVRKYQQQHKLSLEEAARRVRYRFYEDVAHKNHFNKIALGHHDDDNVELILMYLLRGSGPSGLSGIPPVRDGRFIRPLIHVGRSEIMDFLETNGLKYVSDESNRDTRFLRNRIRHQLIPVLKKSYNPAVVPTISRLGSILRAEDEWIETLLDPLFEISTVTMKPDKISLSAVKLNNFHVAATRRIIRRAIGKVKGNLRRISFKHIDHAVALLKRHPPYGELDLPGQIRITRENAFLMISKEKVGLRSLGRLEERPSTKRTVNYEYRIEGSGTLFVKEIGRYLKFSEFEMKAMPDFGCSGHPVAFFDMNSLRFPMVLRNFRPGDRFNPLGMAGSQKVKMFFINNKVPRQQRRVCPLLLSENKIVWIVGHRIDESVKVVPSTRNVLKVELLLA